VFLERNRSKEPIPINKADDPERVARRARAGNILLPRAWNVATFSRMRARIYVKAQKWRYIISSSTPVRISLVFWCWTVCNWPKFLQLCQPWSSSQGNYRGHLCSFSRVI